MTPPLRRRGLGTGQTSQTSLLLFRPPASPYSRTPNSLRIRFTCHNVSPRKEVPRRYGQAYDSLLRCRHHCALRRQLSPERSVQHRPVQERPPQPQR
ncbi:unnamed protein product [Penicillium nalgiovense]|uniref:Uncharacterized protein n=1 Tax=Penicillium nalgiovense TaxID=60175 RepID=A0A9W4HB78_PENNA|nr:unnamed protein product [Penicillium nalgiovense]CAG7954756.1 unnamed protein product [Penicillium nalgiovense]CAG7967351.1 unnamed protein product [Penicillium nalgiovense]CAG7972824.1 unnamed protein product [Penicillium nalgiovense]CAG7973255.1 unnamed protein product [Penicillium nalgiovense]